MRTRKLVKVRDSKTEGTVYPLNRDAEKSMVFHKGIQYYDTEEYRDCFIASMKSFYPLAEFGWKRGIHVWKENTIVDKICKFIKKVLVSFVRMPMIVLNSSLENQMLAIDPAIYEMYVSRKLKNK